MIELAAKWWPVPTLLVVMAQASPVGGLDRLFDLGAIGAVLAVMLWQQYTRESRLAKEVTEREDRMATRIANLEERDHKSVEILTGHNHNLQEYIRDKLMEIVQMQTQNVQSCHNWRDEARKRLFKVSGPVESEVNDE